MATKKKAKTSGQRINRELLERARQQARANDAEDAEEAEAADYEAAEEEVRALPSRSGEAASPDSARAVARRASTAKRLRERNEESRKKALTGEEISELLAHPTKIVSEEELRAQYGFVLRDLRSMAMLAAASFLFLIVLSVVLPK